MIRVVLADDHPIVLQGLRALLEAHQLAAIVGEATDDLTAFTLSVEQPPDVAILALRMPDHGGMEVARRAQEESPGTQVIVLSMYGEEPYLLDALRHGVMGYVLKDAAVSDLVLAVRAVMAGKRFLSERFAERVLDAYVHAAQQVKEPLDRCDLLSNREREVLQLAAQGVTYAAIGERLAISPRTAESHKGNALRKLGLKDQIELVRYALHRGLLPEDR